ncbi:rod shape-determining protein MreD [Paratractidigestivibacter sp.]|uniref:rod shape-determining protein MreD n=1 Tax=Paratractidigestivibacter sp. TaxID=2847316 RepID=UPI002ABE0CAB|nr:rod shape-determining protein MreD [Paratractidigestivibacter sp.]
MQINDKTHDTGGLVALAVICAVCQLALAPNIGIASGRANFALVFAACYALTRGGDAAISAGFFAGLLFDLSTTGPIGLMAFILTLVSRFLGAEQRTRMAADFSSCVVMTFAASLASALAYSLAMLLTGNSSSILDALVFRAIPSAFLTIVAFLPFAYYFLRVRSGSSLGAGRFSSKGL